MELAIDGGRPIRNVPFAPWPQFGQKEVEAVSAVLCSGKVNYWTGDQGKLFEQEYAQYVGAKHAVAVSSGTAALELALHSLGIGAGDEVVVTPRTFIASVSSIVLLGARPVFADVDLDSQNITAETVRPVLTTRTRVIIAVHLAGLPCEMDGLLALADQHGIAVVEDCAQAHGAIYRGRKAGSMGAINATSFCHEKIISTGGEGGIVTTNDKDLWRRAWAFKDHGKSYEASNAKTSAPGFRWLHESWGTNWRMTEMQASIGRVLLPELPERLALRRRNAAVLDRAFTQMPALRVVVPPPHLEHAYYKYYVFVRPEMLKPGWTRDRIMEAVVAEGVPCLSGSCSEIYREKAFPPELRPTHPLPCARDLGETSLMFLVHHTLSLDDMSDTCRAVEKVMQVASCSYAVAAAG